MSTETITKATIPGPPAHMAVVLLALFGAGALVQLTIASRAPAAPTVSTATVGSPQGPASGTVPRLVPEGKPPQSRALTTHGSSLQFKGWELEFFGLVWFLLVLTLELSSARSSPEVQDRFRLHLFAISIVGLGGAFWIASDVLFKRPTVVPFQYAIGAACLCGIFLIAAISRHGSASSALRHIPADGRLVLHRGMIWVGVAVSLAFVATRAAPAEITGMPLGAAFEDGTRPRRR